MSNIEAIELNARKIETLAKVARLLGDQIKEQNLKIDKLQDEIIKLKDALNRTLIPSVTTSPDKKTELVEPSTPKIDSLQKKPHLSEIIESKKEKPTDILLAKDSDKEELIRALKVIDDL